MNAGMRQATDLEQKRRDHELDGARAVLPLALSNMCGYAERSADLLRAMLDASASFPDHVSVPADFNPPELPDEAISVFRDCIRFAHHDEARQLADLLSEYQVQNVRLRAIPDDAHRGRLSKNNVHEYVLDSAELYARAANIFDYARRKERGGVSPIDRSDMRSGLNICGFYEEEYPEIDTIFERRWPAPPGTEDQDNG